MSSDIFTRYASAIDYCADDILALFEQARGWESQYRQIMLLGKRLPPLADEYKQDAHLVKGCESRLWLHHRFDPQSGQYHFAADSDARIIKGLVIIVLAAFNGRSGEQIARFDMADYFARLDLLKHLSPSRSNGIHAVVGAIKCLAP